MCTGSVANRLFDTLAPPYRLCLWSPERIFALEVIPVKIWTSLVAVVIWTAAIAHAASFYGTIRITNDGIPGSGVAFSTSLVDFLAPAGPPNGQAIVLFALGDPDPGPIPGSTALVKDFTPGSFVTDFVTFAGWSGPGYDGGYRAPDWSAWDPFRPPVSPPFGPPFAQPYFADPTGCSVSPFPFCVLANSFGPGSVVLFDLAGPSTSRQLGNWNALFEAWLPQSPAEVIATLDGGQTLVSGAWTADVVTSPEPATSATLVTAICLLILARRRFRVLAR
jgi:hypothetical protein